jgi:hypothetical protein
MTLVQSSPLAYCAGDGKFYPMDQLNIQEERRILAQAIEDAGAHIKIEFDIATADRLGAFLSKGDGRILHFSGHGHPRYLAIEDGWGAMQCLDVDQLKEWVALGGQGENSHRQGLDFVFISACYSRSIGDAFVAAGVPHVVCCDQDSQQIRVDTAVAFQKSFYRALACGDSLRQAFDRARQEIRLSSLLPRMELEEEVRKFCLLPTDGNHDVPIFFTQESRHNYHLQTKYPKRSNRIPVPPSIFLGRQVETYHITRALRRSRLVRVSGKRGMGKKSLAKSACRFIDDRRHILGFDEILWFPSIVKNPDRKLSYLFDNLFDGSQSNREFYRDMNSIIRCLYGRSSLLVLEANGEERIPAFLQKLFEHNDTVKVILIHSNEDAFAGKRMPCIETNVDVPKLDIESSIVLFCSMCPLVLDIKQLHNLLRRAYVEKRLWREDIESMIGEGNPRNTLDAAKQMSDADFRKLLDISRRKALNLKFTSRVALLEKQEQVRKEISEAVRKHVFVRASDMQHMHDEIEKLKREFPDLKMLERRSKDFRSQIEYAINAALFELAEKLRIELDQVETRIRVEKKAMYELDSRYEGDGYDLSLSNNSKRASTR